MLAVAVAVAEKAAASWRRRRCYHRGGWISVQTQNWALPVWLAAWLLQRFTVAVPPRPPPLPPFVVINSVITEQFWPLCLTYGRRTV